MTAIASTFWWDSITRNCAGNRPTRVILSGLSYRLQNAYRFFPSVPLASTRRTYTDKILKASKNIRRSYRKKAKCRLHRLLPTESVRGESDHWPETGNEYTKCDHWRQHGYIRSRLSNTLQRRLFSFPVPPDEWQRTSRLWGELFGVLGGKIQYWRSANLYLSKASLLNKVWNKSRWQYYWSSKPNL